MVNRKMSMSGKESNNTKGNSCFEFYKCLILWFLSEG